MQCLAVLSRCPSVARASLRRSASTLSGPPKATRRVLTGFGKEGLSTHLDDALHDSDPVGCDPSKGRAKVLYATPIPLRLDDIAEHRDVQVS
jgi:hypothetical protein